MVLIYHYLTKKNLFIFLLNVTVLERVFMPFKNATYFFFITKALETTFSLK